MGPIIISVENNFELKIVFLVISVIFKIDHIQRSHNLGLGHLSYNS